MKKKTSKLQRSQRAHERLKRKALSRVGLDRFAERNFHYHIRVLGVQEREKRVLSRKERKYIYNSSY